MPPWPDGAHGSLDPGPLTVPYALGMAAEDPVRTGDLVSLSGNGPVRADGTFVTGKVGRDLDAVADVA